ncbi:hypothetical protein PPERSA_01178 [Pseudocohnilembus persalinus]|uniref:Uncharacterized protein n=1 Tax=Pseudocohnilembus persalinus TaxID=266149 RepID=A0A0V0R241_PSEPJ|nr:hypothetical protein PPERSA_01178 [Pseudocohnilembus persalinus]|eukprot:KRX08248.1 hypothetical protein PPERSA_01178 [Pseudocohnilembus persalinus]
MKNMIIKNENNFTESLFIKASIDHKTIQDQLLDKLNDIQNQSQKQDQVTIQTDYSQKALITDIVTIKSSTNASQTDDQNHDYQQQIIMRSESFQEKPNKSRFSSKNLSDQNSFDKNQKQYIQNPQFSSFSPQKVKKSSTQFLEQETNEVLKQLAELQNKKKNIIRGSKKHQRLSIILNPEKNNVIKSRACSQVIDIHQKL